MSQNNKNIYRPRPPPLREEDFYSYLIQNHVSSPDDLFLNGYPVLDREGKVQIFKTNFFNPHQRRENTIQGVVRRNCARCRSGFYMNGKSFVSAEKCFSHWGKLVLGQFSCCSKGPRSPGCTVSPTHVWTGIDVGVNHPEGFLSTAESKAVKKPDVFALDCEMCYTVVGLEVCKLTLVGFHGDVVYEELVKPENDVLDYNTRFSGITENLLNGEGVKTLEQVQNDLLHILTEDSILVGHGLENDLRVLKLMHCRIVDTALVFEHERGYPFRYSLKQLMLRHLNKIIQVQDDGHDSFVDALSALQLIKSKIYPYLFY